MKKNWTSRLARKEYKKNLRQTFLYLALIIFLLFLLIFLGLPLLIKMAIFIGNIKNTYTPVEKEEIIPPSPPKLRPSFEATNSAQINLEGFAQPETAIKIYLNDNLDQETMTSPDGFFLLADFHLSSGTNEIYAIAENKNNSSSQPSEKMIVVFDDTPPKIIVSEPEENAEIFAPSGKIEIKGEIDEKATMTINDRLVILDSNNKFSYPITLSEGENKIKIIAIDQAFNQSEKEFTITRE